MMQVEYRKQQGYGRPLKMAHGRLVRICAAMLAVCCVWGGVTGVLPVAAIAEEYNSGYRVENNVLYIEDGVQVIGYVPEEMDAEVQGLVHSGALNDYAFDCYDKPYEMRERLEEIILPDSLLYIGEGAFYEVRAKRFAWPEQISRVMDRALNDSFLGEITFHDGVTEYGKYSFCGCEGVERFVVEEGNPALKAVDGVLFSADGKTLLRYPPMKVGEHYDVPAGVEVIADYAFDGCEQLRSVTLPMGVKAIGWAAFSECVRLETVAVPLTLLDIQPYAFSDCVNLRTIRLPQGVQVVCEPEIIAERNSWGGEEWRPEEYVFDNTPLLADYPAWDQCKVQDAKRAEAAEASGAQSEPLSSADDDAPADDSPLQEISPSRYGILNPENARDWVKIYAEASEGSKVLGSFACGSTVEVIGWQEGWYQVWWRRDCDEGAPKGWVREEELLLCNDGEPLFKIASIKLKNSKVYYMSNGLCVLPYDEPKARLPKNQEVFFYGLEGQWVLAAKFDEEWGFGFVYFYPSDLIYTRKHTGDDLRFGIVISDDARDRLNLRSEPSKNGKKLGKYFSGTQVEILDEKGDWYKVRVDFQEGWMMKEFVQEVPQEEP